MRELSPLCYWVTSQARIETVAKFKLSYLRIVMRSTYFKHDYLPAKYTLTLGLIASLPCSAGKTSHCPFYIYFASLKTTAHNAGRMQIASTSQ